VSACEKSALKLPDADNDVMDAQEDKEKIDIADNEQRALPDIARVSINIDTCLPYSGAECGACKVCPVQGAMIWEMEKPRINNDICTGCALCREACIVEPKAIHIQSKYKTV
jgi:ferredoxin-type protein NapG